MVFLSSRMKESLFNIPTVEQSPTDELVVASESFYKLSKARGNTTKRINQIARLVSVLFADCRPPAIARLVVSFLVWPSVYRHLWRALSHVFKKVFVQFPPFANGYAFASILWIACAIFVAASINHAAPANVSSSSFPSRTLPVSDVDFLMGASARFGMTAPDGCIPDDEFFSAVANEPTSMLHGAIPSRFRFSRSGKSKVSDYLSRKKRLEIWHNSFSKTIVTGSASHDAAQSEADIANIHLVPAIKRPDKGYTLKLWSSFVLSPHWAISTAFNRNWGLRLSEFLGSFIRHNVLSNFYTLCLVAGDWRQPITRYDYE